MFNCPSCDKSLRTGSKSCSCGWNATGKKSGKGGELSPLLAASCDHQCTYNDHGTRCRYPVNYFEPGQTKAFCRYHKRYFGDLDMCQKIVARSHRDTEEDYQRRSDEETYGSPRARSILEEEVWQRLYANRPTA